MTNTKTWPSPDQQVGNQGRQDVRGVYLLDPTTNLAYAASGGGGGAIADTIATGNLTAAQPTVGTPVTGGTVSITLGNEQGTVEAQLTGTFSSGTTVQFEGTDDAGVTTNWFATFGKDTTVANAPNISSVAGPGPYLVRIPAAGYQQVRVRASALTGGDNVAVRLIGSVAGTGGANLATNDGSFAKETGGNLASAKADLDTIVTNTNKIPASPAQEGGNLATLAGIVSSNKAATKAAANDIADLATLLTLAGTSGDANTVASFMGRLTKIRDLLNTFAYDNTNELKSSIYGKGAGAAGDTALLLNSDGSAQMDIRKYNGSAVGISNPQVTQQQIAAAIVNGQAFSATTGNLTATNANRAASVFWPNTNAKNVLIYSIQVIDGNANAHVQDIRLFTTDPALANAMTVNNLKNGSGTTSAVSATYSTATTAASGGTAFLVYTTSQSSTNEAFTNGRCYFIPPSTAAGLEIFMGNQATGQIACNVSWIEW